MWQGKISDFADRLINIVMPRLRDFHGASSKAFDKQGNLWVTDPGNNRVLRFPGVINLPANTLEPAADVVLGQTTFTTGTLPTNDPGVFPDVRLNPNILNQPSGLAIDAGGRLYVIDGYSRVLYYSPPAQFVPAARILGIPHKVQQGQTPAPIPNSESIGNVDRNLALQLWRHRIAHLGQRQQRVGGGA